MSEIQLCILHDKVQIIISTHINQSHRNAGPVMHLILAIHCLLVLPELHASILKQCSTQQQDESEN